jgi:hypothetical protein
MSILKMKLNIFKFDVEVELKIKVTTIRMMAATYRKNLFRSSVFFKN